MREIAELGPEDFIDGRMALATYLTQRGKFVEAEKLAREIYPFASDSFNLMQVLGGSVVRQGKPDKDPNTRQRLEELSKIYGFGPGGRSVVWVEAP